MPPSSPATITLRPLSTNDAQAIVDGVTRARDALRRWMPWYRDDYDVDIAEPWIRQSIEGAAAGTTFEFVILAAGERFAGVLGLEGVDAKTGRAMIGYWVAADATGRGVGRRAIALAVEWARRHTQLRVIWAVVAKENRPSRRVLEVNGFRLVETKGTDERGDVALIYELAL